MPHPRLSAFRAAFLCACLLPLAACGESSSQSSGPTPATEPLPSVNPADYREQAQQDITPDNYQSELDSLVQEVNSIPNQ